MTKERKDKIIIKNLHAENIHELSFTLNMREKKPSDS
jgi:hypothetical protein